MAHLNRIADSDLDRQDIRQKMGKLVSILETMIPVLLKVLTFAYMDEL